MQPGFCTYWQTFCQRILRVPGGPAANNTRSPPMTLIIFTLHTGHTCIFESDIGFLAETVFVLSHSPCRRWKSLTASRGGRRKKADFGLRISSEPFGSSSGSRPQPNSAQSNEGRRYVILSNNCRTFIYSILLCSFRLRQGFCGNTG